MPLCVLGGGSNILFNDEGFSGMVLAMSLRGSSAAREGRDVLATAAAGEAWDDFVRHTVDNNFHGLENCSGIPGLVGAAPIQNVGAYGVEVSDCIEWVDVLNGKTGSLRRLTNAECEFAYRDSVFKREEGKDYIVTSVCFRLSLEKRLNTSYKDVARYFNDCGRAPTLRSVREAILRVRGRKFPDLTRHGTVGSFFKNPNVSKTHADKLARMYPDMPMFRYETGVKIPLAWILDNVCNLKGYRKRAVGLWEKQPLVLVNYGGATQRDIVLFAREIAARVRDATNINIEPEVRLMQCNV